MAATNTKQSESPAPYPEIYEEGDGQLTPFPLLEGDPTNAAISDRFSGFVLHRKLSWGWLLGEAIFLGLTGVMIIAIGWLLYRGVGVWGINIPVGWGFAIANFVWWIGIGHAGTFISAILWLLHQEWRTSINRLAEAMTLFAVACAGLFPLLHLGRVEYFYYLMPYPNSFGLWPQWRSPLIWDFAAVLTYLTVSFLFWYVGLLPDLATLRDTARKGPIGYIYALLSLGWRGEATHWRNHQAAYTMLAGLATPLVISVHSIVAFDFAVAIVPGWHSTLFPPYFVAGAIFSGFAMVLTLTIPLRKFYGLDDVITLRHLESCAKVMLATGLMVVYGYVIEAFGAFYAGNPYDRYVNIARLIGPYAPVFALLMFCNVAMPQLLWLRKWRTNPLRLWILSIVVQVGMWTERFVIVVTSLNRDYVPGAWKIYVPTFWDWALLLGTIGFFFFLFMTFIRVLPLVSMAEIRKMAYQKRSGEGEAPGVSETDVIASAS